MFRQSLPLILRSTAKTRNSIYSFPGGCRVSVLSAIQADLERSSDARTMRLREVIQCVHGRE